MSENCFGFIGDWLFVGMWLQRIKVGWDVRVGIRCEVGAFGG